MSWVRRASPTSLGACRRRRGVTPIPLPNRCPAPPHRGGPRPEWSPSDGRIWCDSVVTPHGWFCAPVDVNLAGHGVFHLLINDVIDTLVEFKRRMDPVSRTWSTSAYVVDQASRRGTKACHYLTASVDQSGCLQVPASRFAPSRLRHSESSNTRLHHQRPCTAASAGARVESCGVFPWLRPLVRRGVVLNCMKGSGAVRRPRLSA